MADFTYEDLVPGDFPERQVEGGLPQLLRIWEYLRGLNKGGYGSGVLVTIKGSTSHSASGVTSCSPFTATCIMMALDTRPVDVSQPYALAEPYEPPLEYWFYALHNSSNLSSFGSIKGDGSVAWNARFKGYAAKIPQLPTKFPSKKTEEGKAAQHCWDMINDSAGSLIVHNVAKRVEPRMMRRGDMVAIDWANGHGHATFCWNVHLNKSGEVDAFQFIASNGTTAKGGGYVGVGISNYAYPDVDKAFIKRDGVKYLRTDKPMFVDAIDDPKAYPAYVAAPYFWFALPGFTAKDIDQKSFGAPVQISYLGSRYDPVSVKSLRVARLNGVTPPEPYLRADGKSAGEAATPPPKPKPVAKVTSKRPADAPDEKKTGEEKKAETKAPEKVPPGDPHEKQPDVELNLQQLFRARWIEKDPGDAKNVNDAQSQAAIKDFQERYLGGEVPHLGHADPKTRDVLTRYAAYSMMMPMVHASLGVLSAQGELEKKPGDDPLLLDDATREAVKEFQGKHKLDADGIPGPITQKALARAVGAKKDAPPPPAKKEDEKPGIKQCYWKRNHGPSGSTATLLVTGAPDSQSYPVTLTPGGEAGQIALSGGKGSLDVKIPDGLSDGTEVIASAGGVATQSKFRIDSRAPSKNKVRSGDVMVAGKPFAQWFNEEFQPKHRGNHPTIKVKGKNLPEFPHRIDAANFKAFFDSTKELSGEEEISLIKFAAAFSIPYNETGGTFHPTIEKGGSVWLPRNGAKAKNNRNLINFGEVGYFFWGIPGYKASYNRRDGNWTWPAGDDLKKRGLLNDAEQIEIWNGHPMWDTKKDPIKDDDYPKPLEDRRYPTPKEEPLLSAQKECHFYKFRGRGFTQTTGREGYLKYANPALLAAGYKKVDDLTNAELDKAFSDPKVYVGVYHNDLIAPPGPHNKDFARLDEDEGLLVTIGDRLAGVGANYGEFYSWRCKTLAAAMEEAGWTGG
jgi:hypothetical protein